MGDKVSRADWRKKAREDTWTEGEQVENRETIVIKIAARCARLMLKLEHMTVNIPRVLEISRGSRRNLTSSVCEGQPIMLSKESTREKQKEFIVHHLV